jgi:hypothetical protein
MSDVNDGSNFGDGNFSEYIARERERLRAEREQVFNQQEELQRKLDAVNCEFAAIEAYETAKTGKAARQSPPGRQPRARHGGRREALLDIEEDDRTITHEHHAAGTSASAATSVPSAGTTTPTDRGSEREEVIPLVKEELLVGKRVTERRYRVKSYVIERPVEMQTTVRDERVEIEHRPISRTNMGDMRMPQEREIEVVERHEEPVVEKRATANEEIVVRTEVVERPEIVRGTVRETKIDVEKESVGKAERTTRTTH